MVSLECRWIGYLRRRTDPAASFPAVLLYQADPPAGSAPPAATPSPSGRLAQPTEAETTAMGPARDPAAADLQADLQAVLV